jgi:hypothetical protein
MKNHNSVSKLARYASTLLVLSIPLQSQAAWVGIVGHETANTVQSTSKSEIRQIETIVQGINIDFAGLTWDNTSAAKWNNGEISVARNWAYGYWNDNHGFSVDLIKGDWSGTGPLIGSIGYAYKKSWDNLSLRINPTIATISNKLTSGMTVKDQGAQLNVKLDYAISPRVKVGFHPQYAHWKSDDIGSTLKLEFNVSYDLTEDKRHKLMLVHERFLVNNRASGMRTRYVGEDSPIAGYITGTESTIKVRYAYVF